MIDLNFADLSIESPERINGRPKPRQYPNERTAPRAALDSWKANVCTAASAGPIQGVQPIPNNTPRSGAPSNPPVVRIFGLMVGENGKRP